MSFSALPYKLTNHIINIIQQQIYMNTKLVGSLTKNHKTPGKLYNPQHTLTSEQSARSLRSRSSSVGQIYNANSSGKVNQKGLDQYYESKIGKVQGGGRGSKPKYSYLGENVPLYNRYKEERCQAKQQEGHKGLAMTCKENVLRQLRHQNVNFETIKALTGKLSEKFNSSQELKKSRTKFGQEIQTKKTTNTLFSRNRDKENIVGRLGIDHDRQKVHLQNKLKQLIDEYQSKNKELKNAMQKLDRDMCQNKNKIHFENKNSKIFYEEKQVYGKRRRQSDRIIQLKVSNQSVQLKFSKIQVENKPRELAQRSSEINNIVKNQESKVVFGSRKAFDLKNFEEQLINRKLEGSKSIVKQTEKSIICQQFLPNSKVIQKPVQKIQQQPKIQSSNPSQSLFLDTFNKLLTFNLKSICIDTQPNPKLQKLWLNIHQQIILDQRKRIFKCFINQNNQAQILNLVNASHIKKIDSSVLKTHQEQYDPFLLEQFNQLVKDNNICSEQACKWIAQQFATFNEQSQQNWIKNLSNDIIASEIQTLTMQLGIPKNKQSAQMPLRDFTRYLSTLFKCNLRNRNVFRIYQRLQKTSLLPQLMNLLQKRAGKGDTRKFSSTK